MADDRRRVAEGWRQIQDESEGLLRVAIVDLEDAVAHLARAMEGDVESHRLIALMTDLIVIYETTPPSPAPVNGTGPSAGATTSKVPMPPPGHRGGDTGNAGPPN